MTKRAVILDYSSGNVRSISRSLEYLGCSVSCNLSTLTPNDLLVIPGVGHFESAIQKMHAIGSVERINAHHEYGGRILGICLGMQLLFAKSRESYTAHYCDGLGLIDGVVDILPKLKTSGCRFNLGWKKTFSSTWHTHSMYYVHQFHCKPADSSIVQYYCKWGDSDIVAGIRMRNISAFQFHPEKSSSAGLALLYQELS